MNILESTHSRILAEDAVILFADLQSGIIELSQTNPLDRLRKSVRSLAKLAKLFDIPVIVTGIQGEDGAPAAITPEIAEILGDVPTHQPEDAPHLRRSHGVGRPVTCAFGSESGLQGVRGARRMRWDERANRAGRAAENRERRRHSGFGYYAGRGVGRRLPRAQSATGCRDSL